MFSGFKLHTISQSSTKRAVNSALLFLNIVKFPSEAKKGNPKGRLTEDTTVISTRELIFSGLKEFT